MVPVSESVTSFLQLRLDVREPALVAGFGISRVLGSAVSGESRRYARRGARHCGVVRDRCKREMRGDIRDL